MLSKFFSFLFVSVTGFKVFLTVKVYHVYLIIEIFLFHNHLFSRMLSDEFEVVPEQQKAPNQADTAEPQEELDVPQPPTLIPQAQLDAEWKKTQEDFDKYVAEYTFPDDMTKSGRKKMTKRLHFEFFKKIRRKIEREKWKRKRARCNTEGTALPPKRRKTMKLAESSNNCE